MQIRINSNENQSQAVNAAGAAQEQETRSTGSRVQKTGNKTSIFAGDLGLGMQNDMITQRKQRAQKKALQIITDAWNSDRKIDDTIVGYRDKVAQLRAEIKENQEQIALRDEWKENLRKEYGVREDSQEQKDLELLEKEADVEANRLYDNPRPIYLTDEEKERLAEIHKQERTEYQERCLNLHGQQNSFYSEIDKAKTDIQIYNKAVTATKLARLKTHEMVDAQKEADQIMANASREVIGMLIDEAKDHVDEELEEKTEEAKKEAEERAEQEKKVEERREKQEELEARIDEIRAKNEEQEELRREAEERSREDADLLENMMDAGVGNIGAVMSDVKAAIKEMLHKMKLLEEDVKGSIVDSKLEDSL